MKKLTYIGIFGAFALLSACEEEPSTPCDETKSASALIEDFPDSVKVGTVHPVDVRYILENDCGEFDHFDISQNGKSFEVTLMTKYTGCSCKLELIERETQFDIDVDFPGNYEFSFRLEDGDVDTYSLVVYE
jgi:hypothetical protein